MPRSKIDPPAGDDDVAVIENKVEDDGDAVAQIGTIERPKVGIAVLVVSEDTDGATYIWAGRRKGSHGATKLALPGGHLELNESWQTCAGREVYEEMGIKINDVKFVHATNDIMLDECKHYVTIFMLGTFDEQQQQPENLEPEKCEGWNRYTITQLYDMVDSNELFLPLNNLLKEDPTKVNEMVKSINIASEQLEL